MPTAAAPPRLAGWRPWLMALSLWLLLAGGTGLLLSHLRRDAVDSQTRELNLLSLALTDEIDRGLRGAEEGLRALRLELRDGRLPLDGDIAAALQTRVDLMPVVSGLWLVDADGRVRAASGPVPPPALSGFAPALETLPDDAAALSRPFAPPGGQGQQVALAYRYRVGNREGWILAAVPSSALLGAFGVALPTGDTRIAVIRRDGVRLAGANLAPSALAEAEAAHRLGEPTGMALRRFDDGSEHLVGLHAVPRYAIQVLVSRELSSVLMAWRQAAEVASAGLALLLAVLAAAMHVVLRANRRRAEAQRALQAQLGRASKLEALGTLAGGVAHDFNNVLAGIVGFGEMAQDEAPPGSDQARHLDKVLQAALRGKDLVERILAFSRGGARASMVFALEPVVEEVLTLLSASLRPGVVLERVFEAPRARLRGDPTQAFEAVMNLCTNAMQAMPQGGMLSVELRREAVERPRVLSHSPLRPGDYVALAVSDQGGGITPAVMERLFEPFFTTRGAQSGTGLGLAVVHGVVAEFGGAIDVRSTPGNGARFTLYLPECSDTAGSEPAAPPGYTRGDGQRLLVVDDEPDLVGLALELLEGLGYAPEGFIDAPAALRALRERPQDFAAVVTDEVMPELTGTQLTARLRSFAPNLPVLLVSGYGGALLAQRAAEAGVSRVLAKPLQRTELAQALADLLQARRG